MSQLEVEAVELKRIQLDALRVLIRLGLGKHEQAGPQRNIFIPESRVAWSTVANELGKEGYWLVTPDAYADVCGNTPDEVLALVQEEGTLFALCYGELFLVPMPEKDVVLPDIEV